MPPAGTQPSSSAERSSAPAPVPVPLPEPVPEPVPDSGSPRPRPADLASGAAPVSEARSVVDPARVSLPGAGDVLILEGAPDARDVLLYLHGRCGDPEAFRAFARGVPASVTLISVKGDVRCKTSPRWQWSVGATAIDERLRRIVAAISARRVAAGAAPLREAGWLVFGYSQGALRAEALLARFPDRYAAGVLAAGPRAPRSSSLARTPGGVVVLAGGHDARGHLQKAADDMAREGRQVRYVVLPEARHGEYGPEAEPVVGDALRWILAAPPFRAAGATFQE